MKLAVLVSLSLSCFYASLQFDRLVDNTKILLFYYPAGYFNKMFISLVLAYSLVINSLLITSAGKKTSNLLCSPLNESAVSTVPQQAVALTAKDVKIATLPRSRSTLSKLDILFSHE